MILQKVSVSVKINKTKVKKKFLETHFKNEDKLVVFKRKKLNSIKNFVIA